MMASMQDLVHENAKRTRILFDPNLAHSDVAPDVHEALKLRLARKIKCEYAQPLPHFIVGSSADGTADENENPPASSEEMSEIAKIVDEIPMVMPPAAAAALGNGTMTLHSSNDQVALVNKHNMPPPSEMTTVEPTFSGDSLIGNQIHRTPRPKWHAPWKLMRIISGHLGWVRCVSVDVSNQWFASGAADRVIKIWDLASGQLKVSLTGHISTVRALAISTRHPYLFSAGEDKQVKCWDLETNKVVRHYHGHLSGVYSLALHPTLDVLITGGRDSVARVWDMRTRNQIHVLTGHQNTVASVLAQEADPQVITGSMDGSIRLWDLAAGKTMSVLTHHKKSVRALVAHPKDYTFASASPDNIKQWKCPEGRFIQNLSGHRAIVNALAVNEDDVMFSGADDGSMKFWDWKSGYNYHTTTTTAQSGSLDSEAGIFCSAFDRSGTRLITGEADKSIKIWKEDENATPETHPMDWKPSLKRDHY